MANESMKLTPKQEAFCLGYMETGNASEAYRRSYSASKMKPEVVAVEACKLLASHKVAIRVASLQAAAAKRNEITVDDLIAELEQARGIALAAATPQAGSAVSATMGKAKLLGLGTDNLHLTGELTLNQILASMDGNSSGLPETQNRR